VSESWLRPLLRYAWPTPGVDNLLRASLADDATAAAAWKDFERGADLDHLPGGEMRLVGLVSKRLPDIAPSSPMRPRIAGIERANWSRTQLTIGETSIALRELARGGLDLMLIKGASRTAAGDRLGRGRALNDIDVVVKPESLTQAFDILVAAGWEPAGTGSDAYQRAHLTTGVGLNFVRGRFGNLDLHQSAFKVPQASSEGDREIWARAHPGTLAGVAVLLPSATDALAIALAHGALDAHRSSDWLADAAIAIDTGIDWPLFIATARQRRMVAAALIALTYARERLERPVPDDVLATLAAEASAHPLAALGALIEARPKSGAFAPAWLMRGVVKQIRLARHPRLRASPAVRALLRPSPRRLLRADLRAPGDTPAIEVPLPIAGRVPGKPWAGIVEVTLAVAPESTPRRLDFEVHVGGDFRLRLRARALLNKGRNRLISFRFPLELAATDPAPVLVAAPSRRFNTDAPADVVARYTPCAFILVSANSQPWSPSSG
jgi:hypothetical protein